MAPNVAVIASKTSSKGELGLLTRILWLLYGKICASSNHVTRQAVTYRHATTEAARGFSWAHQVVALKQAFQWRGKGREEIYENKPEQSSLKGSDPLSFSFPFQHCTFSGTP